MQARAFVPNKYYLLIYKRNLISYTDASSFVKKHLCLLPFIFMFLPEAANHTIIASIQHYIDYHLAVPSSPS